MARPLLNQYQSLFLKSLVSNTDRFLIIGGMARWQHYGTATRDLDIVVDVEAARDALEKVLVAWSAQHPAHTFMPLLAPLALRPRIQIKFPEDVCWFLDNEGEPREIAPEDGIDVLTSIEGHEFGDLFERRVTVSYDGLLLNFISRDDLENIAASMRRG